MTETDLQYYRQNIGKTTKRDPLNCFTFIDFYSHLNDYVCNKGVYNSEGFILTQNVVDILLPFVLSGVKSKQEYLLCKIMLSNIYDTYSIYNVAKYIGIADSLEHTLGNIRARVFLEHREYYNEVNGHN